MLIARVYATLAAEADRAAVFPELEAEYRRTESALCRLTGQKDLLDEAPWLQRSIRVRNPSRQCARTGMAPSKPLAQWPAAIRNRRNTRRAVVRFLAAAHPHV